MDPQELLWLLHKRALRGLRCFVWLCSIMMWAGATALIWSCCTAEKSWPPQIPEGDRGTMRTVLLSVGGVMLAALCLAAIHIFMYRSRFDDFTAGIRSRIPDWRQNTDVSGLMIPMEKIKRLMAALAVAGLVQMVFLSAAAAVTMVHGADPMWWLMPTIGYAITFAIYLPTILKYRTINRLSTVPRD